MVPRSITVGTPPVAAAPAKAARTKKATHDSAQHTHHAAKAKHYAFTGYGSTTAAWNSAHTHDYQFTKGAVYNPDPGLPQDNGHVGADYTAVQHQLGHITGYYLNFRNEPISDAKQQVIADELPRDAHEVWFIGRGSDCALELFTSPTLARLLGAKKMGDTQGAVLVEYSSGSADESYDPYSVNQASFLLGEVEPVASAGMLTCADDSGGILTILSARTRSDASNGEHSRRRSKAD